MAGRGFLPTGEAAHRGKTLPTTQLPITGRTAPPPECPYDLEPGGAKWWEWAWKTPQAAGWSDGDAYFVARRARLEDTEQTQPVVREMREMDDRLGLTPKGLAALRWKIVEPDEGEKAGAPASGRKGLALVDKAG
jgi:hypothetical protein